MFKTQLMTAAAVLTLTIAGAAHAQTSPNTLGTADQSAPSAGQVNGTGTDATAQADGSVAASQPAEANTGISSVASADEASAPVRSKAENNRMSRKEANKVTAELNQQQLQGLPSNSLAASSDTGLRTTDNSSVAAGSVASPTPSTKPSRALAVTKTHDPQEPDVDIGPVIRQSPVVVRAAE